MIASPNETARDVDPRVIDTRILLSRPPLVQRLWHLGSMSYADRVSRLTGRLEQTADPASWKSSGGSVGAIAELNGQLVVTQSARNQAAVEDSLWRMGLEALSADLAAIFICAACGASAVILLRDLRARRRRRMAGRCAACGYDLRASPGGCPECGHPPKHLSAVTP